LLSKFLPQVPKERLGNNKFCFILFISSYGYMLRLSKKRLVINSERCGGDNSHEDHKALEAALTAFGVNLGEPVFALIIQAEVLQGLSPMVRFMKE